MDEKQQQAFIRIMETGKYDVNPIRKFLTAAKKTFGESILEYRRNKSVLLSDGSIHHYMSDRDGWHKQ